MRLAPASSIFRILPLLESGLAHFLARGHGSPLPLPLLLAHPHFPSFGRAYIGRRGERSRTDAEGSPAHRSITTSSTRCHPAGGPPCTCSPAARFTHLQPEQRHQLPSVGLLATCFRGPVVVPITTAPMSQKGSRYFPAHRDLGRSIARAARPTAAGWWHHPQGRASMPWVVSDTPAIDPPWGLPLLPDPAVVGAGRERERERERGGVGELGVGGGGVDHRGLLLSAASGGVGDHRGCGGVGCGFLLCGGGVGGGVFALGSHPGFGVRMWLGPSPREQRAEGTVPFWSLESDRPEHAHWGRHSSQRGLTRSM